MKTKSKPTTPFENVTINLWKVSGQPVTIDEFIERGIDCVDATGFRYALRSLNGRLWEKLQSINADEYPGLREAIQEIIQVFESREAWQAKDPLPRWLAEVAFGARYLLKRFDFVADHLPGIGLADDAQLLERILERNQLELRRHLGKPSAVADAQNP
jgi:uncharacterized membrane protein YkvA (DUF1232 family)